MELGVLIVVGDVGVPVDPGDPAAVPRDGLLLDGPPACVVGHGEYLVGAGARPAGRAPMDRRCLRPGRNAGGGQQEDQDEERHGYRLPGPVGTDGSAGHGRFSGSVRSVWRRVAAAKRFDKRRFSRVSVRGLRRRRIARCPPDRESAGGGAGDGLPGYAGGDEPDPPVRRFQN